MNSAPPAPAGGRALLRACWRAVSRLAKLLFFVALMLIPIPIAVFPRPGRRDRRNLPAQVLKKD